MSDRPRPVVGRRQFLGLLLDGLLVPLAGPLSAKAGQAADRTGSFAIALTVLYGLFDFHVDGVLTEVVDPAAGHYHVTAAGHGDALEIRVESRGLLLGGRWVPSETHSWFKVVGRESRHDIVYDWRRRTVDYSFRGETFLLRRMRVAHDVVPVTGTVGVDDAVSAILNYREGRWLPQSDGAFLTHVVRRERRENERPDDVQDRYGAELAPLYLRVTVDPGSGKRVGRFDLSGFSSWARPDRPARITFGPDGRPEQIAMEMILGTTVRVAFGEAEQRPAGRSRDDPGRAGPPAVRHDARTRTSSRDKIRPADDAFLVTGRPG